MKLALERQGDAAQQIATVTKQLKDNNGKPIDVAH